jgi:hypothetical protein
MNDNMNHMKMIYHKTDELLYIVGVMYKLNDNYTYMYMYHLGHSGVSYKVTHVVHDIVIENKLQTETH